MCHNDTEAPPPPNPLTPVRPASGVPVLTGGSAGDYPVVLVTDIYGISPFYEHLAGLLASGGYRVVMPDLFHRVGPARDASREAALERRAKLDDREALEDLRHTVASLDADKYAVVGFCLGGTLALLTAANHPVQATVTFYAFPRAVPGARHPLPEPIDVAGDIRGDVLAMWGREDYISAEDIDELERRLPDTAEVVRYDGVGHTFLSGLTEADGGVGADVARDAWSRTVGFLGRHADQWAAS